MKRTLILIATIAVCSGIAAQSKIEQLFKDMSAWDTQTVEKNNYEDDSASPTTFCYQEKIVMDKKKAGDLDRQFINTFNDETKNAYTFYSKTEYTPNSSTLRISYGTKNEYSVEFGTKSAHNYLVALFRDQAIPAKRTAYALVWYDKGNNIEILRYHIYGDDPKQKKARRSIVIGDMGLEITDNKNTIFTMPNSNGKSEQTINDIEFMKQFGTLLESFRRNVTYDTQEDRMLCIGFVVKIVDLCKKHNNILTDNERITCEKSLMAVLREKSINDPYLCGMFEEARLALQKK